MQEDEKRRYTKLTEAQWLQVEAEYAVGDAKLSDLSDRHGVSIRTIQYRFDERGIAKGSAAPALAPAIAKRTYAEDNADPIADLMTKARAVRQDAYDAADTIERLLLGQLAAAQNDPAAMARMGGTMKSLSLAAAVIERTSAIKRAALGINDDSALGQALPELVIADITESEIERIQNGLDDNADEVVELDLPADFA